MAPSQRTRRDRQLFHFSLAHHLEFLPHRLLVRLSLSLASSTCLYSAVIAPLLRCQRTPTHRWPLATADHANMLSVLPRITYRLQSASLSSTASPLAVLGRVNYSSLPDSGWTPTHRYSNKYNEARARRIATDPEYRESIRARRAKWLENNRDENNAKGRQYKKEKRLIFDFDQHYYASQRYRWASDHHYHQRESLRGWITKNSWVRDLDWPTHKPVYTSEKILRQCPACHAYRHIKLWWQDKKTDDFLCHPCFTNDWSRALPIGYEDKVFGRRKSSETKSGSTSKPEP